MHGVRGRLRLRLSDKASEFAAADCATGGLAGSKCARAMERYSIIDHSIVDRIVDPIADSIADPSMKSRGSSQPGAEPEPDAGLEPGLEPRQEHGLAQSSINRSLHAGVSSPSVSAGIAAANALAAGAQGEASWRSSPRFPGEDGGHSLAEMAERDLDAALQLLADRAQYITGAGGAAIALRRDERNDMLCRASAGSKAPELGALLSTESGLSGESVRTRMPLRCDDAERDPRVNQESCRQLGIASVMIVPIVGQDVAGDDQVLGVFELFSGQAGAFEERDLSALQRLGEMVETAVKLARAAQGAPLGVAIGDEIPVDINNEITTGEHRGTTGSSLFSAEPSMPSVFADDEPVLEVEMEEAIVELPGAALAEAGVEAAMASVPAVDPEAEVVPPQAVPATISPVPPIPIPSIPAGSISAPSVASKEQPARRPLMWSAAAQGSPEPAKPVETDQSHVPPMLRNLRKCKACGFPVSEGRTLCVECDEKQWRGQPLPSASGKAKGASPAVDFRQTGSADSPGLSIVPPKPAAAPAAANLQAISPSTSFSIPAAGTVAPQSLAAVLAELREQESRVEATRRGLIAVPAKAAESTAPEATAAPPEISAQAQTTPPEGSKAGARAESVREALQQPATPNFSGGLGTSQSWLGANKYILGAILVIAAVVAAIAWFR